MRSELLKSIERQCVEKLVPPDDGMNISDGGAKVRAEHESLSGYLSDHLSSNELSRPLVVSFSQWEMNTSVVGEIAATLHSMKTNVAVALWADKTPMRDVGWTTSHSLARLFLSPARDQRVARGLRDLGMPRDALCQPPLRRWRPQRDLPVVDSLERSSIRYLEYRGAPVGRAILQVHPDSETPVREDFEWPRRWVEASLESFAYAYDQVWEVVRQRRSTCLVVFNGRFLHDAAAHAAAESHGLPVLSFDFGGNDTDYDLTRDATHDWSALQDRMKKLYSSWDENERDEVGSRWFEDRRHHEDKRNARFVESQVVGRGVELPRDKRIVVFFSSSGDEISELDVDWEKFFYGQPGALAAVAQICRESKDTFLIVRTHPHKRMKARLDVEDWHKAVETADPDMHLDEWSDVDSYTLMDLADVVVTFGSTTGVEAAYAKRPVIVLGPSAYDELECAANPVNANDLRVQISDPERGAWQGAVSYGLMMLRRGFHFEWIRKSPDRLELGGVRLVDSIILVLKWSDWSARRQARRLR